LKELFKSLDINGDGSLTFEELSKGLKGKENGDTLL
jgi:Ca2+-binding EF-hand superfamily protein